MSPSSSSSYSPLFILSLHFTMFSACSFATVSMISFRARCPALHKTELFLLIAGAAPKPDGMDKRKLQRRHLGCLVLRRPYFECSWFYREHNIGICFRILSAHTFHPLSTALRPVTFGFSFNIWNTLRLFYVDTYSLAQKNATNLQLFVQCS